MGSHVFPTRHCQLAALIMLPAENILGASTMGPGNLAQGASEQGAEAAPPQATDRCAGQRRKELGIV